MGEFLGCGPVGSKRAPGRVQGGAVNNLFVIVVFVSCFELCLPFEVSNSGSGSIGAIKVFVCVVFCLVCLFRAFRLFVSFVSSGGVV